MTLVKKDKIMKRSQLYVKYTAYADYRSIQDKY